MREMVEEEAQRRGRAGGAGGDGGEGLSQVNGKFTGNSQIVSHMIILVG